MTRARTTANCIASVQAERPQLLCYGCYGCDAARPFRRAYCRSCEEVTDSYEYGTLSVPLVTAVAVDPTADPERWAA